MHNRILCIVSMVFDRVIVWNDAVSVYVRAERCEQDTILLHLSQSHLTMLTSLRGVVFCCCPWGAFFLDALPLLWVCAWCMLEMFRSGW